MGSPKDDLLPYLIKRRQGVKNCRFWDDIVHGRPLSIQGHVTSGVRHLFEPKIMLPILHLILGLFKDILGMYRVVLGLLHNINLIALL